MFSVEALNYRAITGSPLVGAYQAIRELNNKTDGVADDLLPNTQLRFAFRDSKCDSTSAIGGVISLARDVFDGAGVKAIIGAACSSASVTATLISRVDDIPMVSASSTSPALSNAELYPYFLRTVPSDEFIAVAMTSVIKNLWQFKSVAMVHSTEAYGAGLAQAFATQASLEGITIHVTLNFVKDSKDFSSQQRALAEQRSRIIILFCAVRDFSRFVRSAYTKAGIGGPGFLFLSGDTASGSGVWTDDPELNESPSLRETVLRGYFSMAANGQLSGTPAYDSYFARRQKLTPVAGNGTTCNWERDDDGGYLWAQDHDNNPSTPLECVKFDVNGHGDWDVPFAYDAVFSIAHALHHLIEVENRTEVLGSELLDALIANVSFEGVTGLVNFFDGSANPDRLYTGDRRIGIGYSLLNYVDNAKGLVTVGTWKPCTQSACSWEEQYYPASNLTYSTSDNSVPLEFSPQRVTEVRIGVLIPMFATASAGLGEQTWSPLVGAHQALKEINNKTDGVLDHLLPNTRILVAFSDSRCDSVKSLSSALHLSRDAFGGKGVHAIVGAGCSSASVPAAQVTAVTHVPMVSPTSTSPALSDGKGYPYFARVAPSDSFTAIAMISVLQNLWNYTSVALVHSTDAYGAGIAKAFADTAFEEGLNIHTTQSFTKDATDFSSQYRGLQRAGSRVIVLLCSQSDFTRFMLFAYNEAGIGGDGYLFFGGDTAADTGLWLGHPSLASDLELRRRVLRGTFAMIPNGQLVGTPNYDSYLARRKLLTPVSGNGTSCNLEKDDDGTYMWASDHDDDPSTPLACVGFDVSEDGAWDAFGYDSSLAIVTALHELIEVQNRTEIVGSELLEALITKVNVQGVTGLLNFYDASDDPDRLYNGDRRVGVGFTLRNFVDSTQGLVTVGIWTPCNEPNCPWEEQYQKTRDLTYSTGDNSQPKQTAPARVRSAHIGLLLPMFGLESSDYAPFSWSPRIGAYQAIREINNKSDGVFDHLLPTTELRISFRDPKCDSSSALSAALYLTRDAFNGEGVHAIVGAGCSGPAGTAASVAEGSYIPIITPSAHSQDLSDGQEYPYLLRTYPADNLASAGMVDILVNMFGYSSVALVASTDPYGSAASSAFNDAALAVQDFSISTTIVFATEISDFRTQLNLLRSSSASIVVLFAQEFEAARFLKAAYAEGIGGQGYLWMFGDTSVELAQSLSTPESLRKDVLQGSFSLVADNGQGQPAHQAYLARRQQWLSSYPEYPEGVCNQETDDDGSYLWQQDHDQNISTPMLCAPVDRVHEAAYDAFGYDAVLAIAHGLHDLVEVQNRTQILGPELLESLISRVRFEGVTGLVDFETGTGPNDLYKGDRREGVTFLLMNFADSSFRHVGDWFSCASCSWSTRWQSNGQPLTYSTADNTRPQQTANCPYGEIFSIEGQCVCDDGFEIDATDTSRCRSCDPGQDSRRARPGSPGSQGCTVCAAGFYRPDATSPADECVACDISGVDCPFNSTLASLNITHGFWRPAGTSEEVWACGVDGSWSPCAGGRTSELLGSGYCQPGYYGPRCELCEGPKHSKYFDDEDSRCHDCGDVGSRTGLIIGICLAIVLTLGLGAALFTWMGKQRHLLIRHFLIFVKRSLLRISTLALMPKLKLVIAFYQSVLALPRVYDVHMPASYYDWVSAFEWLELSFDDLVIPGACVNGGFSARLVIYAMMPMFLMLGVLVLSTFSYIAERFHMSRTSPMDSTSTEAVRPTFWRGLMDKWLLTLPLLLFISFCLVTGTSQNIFSAWHCSDFVINSETGETRSFMVEDLSVECETPEHNEITTIATVFVILWPVGFPLLYFSLLAYCSKDIKQKRNTRMKKATSFLHFEYTLSLYWWEPFFLLERLAVAGFLKLLPDNLKYIRLSVGLYITIFYMVLLLALMPYRRQDLNFLAAFGAQFALGCIFLGAMDLELFEGITSSTSDQSIAQKLMGYESPEQIVGIMIAFIFTVVGLFAAATIIQFGRKPPLGILILDKTKQPPELSLHNEFRWHLFLSHIWSSGQDQVANIKRQLQLLLPGVSIFLDVDDLVTIDALEVYIQQSQSILIFLSKGYFYSTNCKRELDESVSREKALVMVHETDLNRGGAPLSVLKEDCAADKRFLLFTQQTIIPWYRISEFQIVSLRLIAQGLLQASPLFQEMTKSMGEAPQLLSPSEVTRKKIKFHKDVYLYVSSSNPGAKQLGCELELSLDKNSGLNMRRSVAGRAASDGSKSKGHSDSPRGTRTTRATDRTTRAVEASRAPGLVILSAPKRMKRQSRGRPSVFGMHMHLHMLGHGIGNGLGQIGLNMPKNIPGASAVSHAPGNLRNVMSPFSNLMGMDSKTTTPAAEVVVASTMPEPPRAEPKVSSSTSTALASVAPNDAEKPTNAEPSPHSEELKDTAEKAPTTAVSDERRRSSVKLADDSGTWTSVHAAAGAILLKSRAKMQKMTDKLTRTSQMHEDNLACLDDDDETEDEPEPDFTPPPSEAHFLLYLNDQTFIGAAGTKLANQVRQARTNGIHILLCHETDPNKGGMEFGKLFQTTPQDLVMDGLYKELAIMLAVGEHRNVSYSLTAKGLGVLQDRRQTFLEKASRKSFNKLYRFFQRGVDGTVSPKDKGSSGSLALDHSCA
ncbi:hypothetical protein AB1Y20_016052 [Prymnesium parvum]|uniref:Receptor ligand binding region domain-containing protein n=1 Tax=Prymnesium parvum TaxID=97485 RepID=A0AB34JYF9_PRYPA